MLLRLLLIIGHHPGPSVDNGLLILFPWKWESSGTMTWLRYSTNMDDPNDPPIYINTTQAKEAVALDTCSNGPATGSRSRNGRDPSTEQHGNGTPSQIQVCMRLPLS